MWSSASYKCFHLLCTPLVECASDRFFCEITGQSNLYSSNSHTLLNCDSSAWPSWKILWLRSLVVELNMTWRREIAGSVLTVVSVAMLQFCELHSRLCFCCTCSEYCVVFRLPPFIAFSSSSSRPNFGRAPRRKPTWASWSRKPTRNTWKQRKMAQATPMKAAMRNIRLRWHTNTMTSYAETIVSQIRWHANEFTYIVVLTYYNS